MKMSPSTRKCDRSPREFHTVTPHLVCAGAAEAIEFYRKAFGAVELSRIPGPDGKVMHASIRIGDSVVMLNDEMPKGGTFGPKSLRFARHDPPLRRGRRRRLRAGRPRRGQGDDAARRYVLGRSLRQAGGSVWASMVNRHACPRREPRRNAKSDGANGLLTRAEASIDAVVVSTWRMVSVLEKEFR